LFALSAIVSVTSMARACALSGPGSEERFTTIEAVIELFTLTRGIRDVIHLNWLQIHHGPLGELLKGFAVPASAWVVLPSEVETRFAQLREFVGLYPADINAKGHCISAIDGMRSGRKS
jgi:hypothetical protein